MRIRAIVAAIASFVGLLSLPVSAGAVRMCFGQPATIVGTPTRDVLVGTDGNDVIVGGGGADEIRGRGGKDRICGEDGNHDDLRGGRGFDRISGGRGDDDLKGNGGDDFLRGDQGEVYERQYGERIWGGPGDDRMIGTGLFDHFYPGPGDDFMNGDGPTSAAVHYENSDRRVRVDLREGVAFGEGRDVIANVRSVVGSRFDDVLLGNGDQNRFTGMQGNDTMFGRANKDFFDRGVFFEHVHEPRIEIQDAGADRMFGGSGRDWLSDFRGADEAYGQDSADRVSLTFTHSSKLALDGGPGEDELDAAFDRRRLVVNLPAGRGSLGQTVLRVADFEVIFGGDRKDRIIGDDGNSKIVGGRGDDFLHGKGGNDRLLGQQQDDVLRGGSGDDRLAGHGGSDDLDGQQGDDKNYGGPGNDTCRSPSSGNAAFSCENL